MGHEEYYLPRPLVVVFVALLLGAAAAGFTGVLLSGPSATRDTLRLIDQPLLLSVEAFREHSPSRAAAEQHARFLIDVCGLLKSSQNRELNNCRDALLSTAEKLSALAIKATNAPDLDPTLAKEIRGAISDAGFQTLALHSALQSMSPAEKRKLQIAGEFETQILSRLEQEKVKLSKEIEASKAFTGPGPYKPDDSKKAFSASESLCLSCREAAALSHLIGTTLDGAILDRLNCAREAILGIANNEALFPKAKKDPLLEDLAGYVGNIELRIKILKQLVAKPGMSIGEILVSAK